MNRGSAFKGHLITDLLAWAGGGFLVGGMFGYGFATIWNRITDPAEPRDPVWVGNRDAYRGAIFALTVAACGHMLRAIL